MAQLTPEQWSTIKAEYATGKYSNRELGRRHGITHAAINKKAAAEGWTTIDADVVDAYVKSHVEIKEAVSTVSTAMGLEVSSLETALSDLATFEAESNRIMARIDAKALEMLDFVDKPNDVKAIMDVHQKHREARLGKSPDTAIQINNNAPPPTVIQIVAAPTK